MMWLLYILTASSACERGCLSTESPLSREMAVKQDCPTGMARCVAGAVEVTEGHPSCAGCACAWKRIEVCTHGCAVENVELAREPSLAGSLCQHPMTGTSTLPEADAATTACPNEGERYLCRRGVVYACTTQGQGVPVAICSFGCAEDDETLATPEPSISAATTVMCRPSALLHDSAVAPP